MIEARRSPAFRVVSAVMLGTFLAACADSAVGPPPLEITTETFEISDALGATQQVTISWDASGTMVSVRQTLPGAGTIELRPIYRNGVLESTEATLYVGGKRTTVRVGKEQLQQVRLEPSAEPSLFFTGPVPWGPCYWAGIALFSASGALAVVLATTPVSLPALLAAVALYAQAADRYYQCLANGG